VKSKRVEVLFDPKEYRTLEERAEAEGRSVGSMIREAVAMYVTSPSDRDKREALEWIFSREDDLGTWEELKGAIQRGPAEEMEEIEREIEGDRR
jgi:Ribbon-helix-helix protein, copG family